MAKVAIIGAGFVGSTAAYALALRSAADEIVLVDVKPGAAHGKALDISQAMPVFGLASKVMGGTEYGPIAGADVVVITAGVPRGPDQKREDVLAINARIMRDVIREVKLLAPRSVLVIVSNPLDAMTYLAWKESGFERRKVIGMAGTLDTARYKAAAAERLGIAGSEVEAFVLGGHGDLMVPLSRLATVEGKPLASLMDEKTLRGVEERTREGGAEIVSLLAQSAYFAPAAAICEVVEAILKGGDCPVPVSAWLEGEYGISGIFLGVPCRLGPGGVEKVVELDLDERERKALHASAAHVRRLLAELK